MTQALESHEIPTWILDRMTGRQIRHVLATPTPSTAIIKAEMERPIRIVFEGPLEMLIHPSHTGVRFEVLANIPNDRRVQETFDNTITTKNGHPQRQIFCKELEWEGLIDADAATRAQKNAIRASIQAMSERFSRGEARCITGRAGSRLFINYGLGGFVMLIGEDMSIELYAVAGREDRDWTDEGFMEDPTSYEKFEIPAQVVQRACAVAGDTKLDATVLRRGRTLAWMGVSMLFGGLLRKQRDKPVGLHDPALSIEVPEASSYPVSEGASQMMPSFGAGRDRAAAQDVERRQPTLRATDAHHDGHAMSYQQDVVSDPALRAPAEAGAASDLYADEAYDNPLRRDPLQGVPDYDYKRDVNAPGALGGGSYEERMAASREALRKKVEAARAARANGGAQGVADGYQNNAEHVA